MKYLIWIDEAWRGPWLGPVSACALCFNRKNMPSKKFISRLNDSKKLSEKKREGLYWELIEMSRGAKPQIFFWVGIVDNFVIDEINIRQANREAMRRALSEVLRKIPHSPNLTFPPSGGRDYKSNDAILSPEGGELERGIEVLVDGRDNYEFEELKKQPEYIVGWDWKIPEIWAASIIAKVFRDKLLVQYATLYPDLWIENHKWYGTKKHRENLKKLKDITGIHRMSYKPVKKVLEGGK